MTQLAYRTRPDALDAPPIAEWTLILGSVLPAGVILLELFTGLCANVFFDPLPTPGHLILAGAVPLANGTLWWAARQGADARGLVVAAGASAAVAFAWALMFLPILPFAAVAILIGVGVLPFAPVAAGVVAWRLGWRAAAERERGGRELWAGVALGAVALVAVDGPATATHLALGRYAGDAGEREGAVSLMRRWGDRELLLRSAYGDTARATGLLSLVAAGSYSGGRTGGTEAARELYFRVTGQAFNAAPRPGHGVRNDLSRGWDEDQGGERVGGRVDALSIASSLIDGSAAFGDNLAYLEWTLEIANADPQAREARMTLALPEGAVASRATLWVNGEPREASVAGRAEVRAAYQSIVSTQRDPLLVTTDGAQRLLVQVFPVPAGGKAKIRVGFTAPFRVAPDGSRDVALPAIVDGNFDPGDRTRHALWVEADGPLSSSMAGLAAAGRTVRGDVSGADLLAKRPRLVAPRLAGPAEARGFVPDSPGIGVVQRVERVAAARPAALMLVVDGSAGNRDAGLALADALDAVPTDVPVGLALADDEATVIAPAPWSAARRAAVADAIRGADYRGGRDDRDALAAALAHAGGASGAVLWVHGAQPVDFAETTARLEQTLARVPSPPRLVRYQAEPGRARALGGEPLFETARLLTPTGDAPADLRAALAELSGAAPAWRTTRVEADVASGSPHVARLWAAGRIAAKADATGAERTGAVALAHRLNLVTPLSGAVVLETDADYKANGLPLPGAAEVPTVPEPGTWALLILAAAMAGLALRARPRVPAR